MLGRKNINSPSLRVVSPSLRSCFFLLRLGSSECRRFGRGIILIGGVMGVCHLSFLSYVCHQSLHCL
jgi:hypothetical protein